jgi:SAM-dependent methyltransferase
MEPKAKAAQVRGLNVINDYLRRDRPKVDVVSVVDVFSHIPDFKSFLTEVTAVLKPNGEIFIETGNLADIEHRHEFVGDLDLPDHLVFAGEGHIVGFLEDAGFRIVKIERHRIDTVLFFAKSIVKKILGRPATVRLPNRSAARSLLIRARLRHDTIHGDARQAGIA